MPEEPAITPADPCFTVQDVCGHTVVVFTTEALVGTGDLERIGRELYDLADRKIGPGRRLVLDFQKVRLFSSQAVGILLTLNRKLGRRRAFILCGVTPELIQLLRITRLDQVLSIKDTQADAVKP